LTTIPWQGFLKDKGGMEFTTTYLSLPKNIISTTMSLQVFNIIKLVMNILLPSRKIQTITNSIEGFKESNEGGLT
jgi:hypothetical protein